MSSHLSYTGEHEYNKSCKTLYRRVPLQGCLLASLPKAGGGGGLQYMTPSDEAFPRSVVGQARSGGDRRRVGL